MTSLGKRFSTIIRQNASSTPQKVPEKEVPDKTNADAQPAAATNGTTTTEPAPATEGKPATENGATAASVEPKPAKDKVTPAPTPKKDTKKEKDGKENVGKSTIKRFSTILRSRGQSNGKATKAKTDAAAAAAAASKIPKKGAAKGKRVVIVTGASKGIGLELVKQFAAQPDTFVIALSRTADKASTLRPIVSASAKEGHNVRVLKLDVTSTRSLNNAVKEIVELTDGRIDLVVNAAGSKSENGLNAWDIKGPDLEDELRINLIGPITFTNSLLPYLKRFEKEKKENKEDKAEEKEEKPEVKEGEKVEEKVEKTENKDGEPATAATTEAPAVTSEEPPVESTSEAVAPTEPEPEPEPEPEHLPASPFVIFLAPSSPIHNAGGYVTSSGSWVPEPRTLFSISRAALQVAIGKYATGLLGNGIGLAAIERPGQQDPNSTITDEQAAGAILKLLPDLTLRDNGKLLKTSA